MTIHQPFKGTWKVVPPKLLTVDHYGRATEQAVTQIYTIPPGSKRGVPICDELTAVVVVLANGRRRYFGTTAARISSALRMEIVVNPSDDVLRGWDDALPAGAL